MRLGPAGRRRCARRGTSPRATFPPPGLVESGGDLPRPRPGRFANRPYRGGGGRRAGRSAPAHRGMKKHELWFGTVGSAAPRPDPSGGQAPALHFPPSPPLWTPAPYSGYAGMLWIPAGVTSREAGWLASCRRTGGQPALVRPRGISRRRSRGFSTRRRRIRRFAQRRRGTSG